MPSITTSQTIGPFPHESWRWAFDATSDIEATGAIIEGAVYDGAGQPIDDAVLEAWMPDAAPPGLQQAPSAFRRVPTGAQGEFRFVLPAPLAGHAGEPAMFVTLFARGVLKHQFTAVFLDDDAGLAQSPLLQQVLPERRATLITRKIAAGRYRWDIRMQDHQGQQETVFFDYA